MHNTATALRGQPASWELDSAPVALPKAEARSPLAPGSRECSHDRAGRPPEARIKRILVPTDFSPASAKGVERAVALANQCHATLTILHVIDINAPAGSGPAEDLMKRLWGVGSARLGQLAWSLCGQVEAQTALAEGLPWEVIVEQGRGFDLMIMGKPRAKTGWKPFSQHTAQRVVENAACPVLVVHQN